MKKPETLPPMPDANNLEAMQSTLANLLEYVAKNRLEDLLNAGLNTQDCFLLRRVARQYRIGKIDPQDYQAFQVLLPKLEAIPISF